MDIRGCYLDDHDRARIEQLWGQHLSIAIIAARISKSAVVVRRHLKKRGIWEADRE